MVYEIVGAMMVLDWVVGTTGAIKNGTYNSTKAREGLFHKLGFIFMIALAFILQRGMPYLDMPVIPLVVPVCGYIIVTECGSIIENLHVINPKLVPKVLHKFFGKIIETE